MKNTLSYILIFTLFSSLTAVAQLRNVTGLVTAEDARQSGAVIKNQDTQIQTISNDVGEFSIRVKTGDTLITVKEGYNNDTLTITNDPYFVVRLKKEPLVLKEVTVNGTALTPEKKLAENKGAYKEIYRKGDKSNAIIITPLGVGVVIDKVWSAVSKEGADARRLQRTFNADYKNSIIDRRFTKIIVSRITGYKGDELFNFMSKYRPTYKMVKNDTDYELIQYIKKSMLVSKRTTAAK